MTLVDLLAMGLRIAALVAVLQASGIALFRAVFHARAGQSERAMARRALAFVLLAIALTAIAHLFESARLAGASERIVPGSAAVDLSSGAESAAPLTMISPPPATSAAWPVGCLFSLPAPRGGRDDPDAARQ